MMGLVLCILSQSMGQRIRRDEQAGHDQPPVEFGSWLGNTQTVPSTVPGKRRFFQLQSLISYYVPEFDERKIWFYGCNCLMESDRPMSAPGYGKPVDRLDRLCQKWKSCQRCARASHGDKCIGELEEYTISYRTNELSCHTNGRDTCQRALCECDLEFAKGLPDQIDSYSDDFHSYWSPPEIKWEPKEDCVKHEGGPKMTCCGGINKPFFQINSNQEDCCINGTTAPKGQCNVNNEASGDTTAGGFNSGNSEYSRIDPEQMIWEFTTTTERTTTDSTTMEATTTWPDTTDTTSTAPTTTTSTMGTTSEKTIFYY